LCEQTIKKIINVLNNDIWWKNWHCKMKWWSNRGTWRFELKSSVAFFCWEQVPTATNWEVLKNEKWKWKMKDDKWGMDEWFNLGNLQDFGWWSENCLYQAIWQHPVCVTIHFCCTSFPWNWVR
jgi:hypothetical protein